MNFLKYENGITMIEALGVSVTGIIVVLIVLAILAVLVLLLSKGIRLVVKDKKNVPKKSEAAAVPASPKPHGTALPVTQSAGTLELYKTDEKTAAVIMAIVSNESGIELNRLRFNSIKLIEE